MYDFCQEDFTIDNIMQQFYYPEHNDKYFIQCYYNLEEKHDRGIISDEEWRLIQDEIKTKNKILVAKKN